MNGKAQELYEKNKGVIDIEYNPIICMGCSKLLANTYVQKTDSYHLTVGKFYIYCEECVPKK